MKISVEVTEELDGIFSMFSEVPPIITIKQLQTVSEFIEKWKKSNVSPITQCVSQKQFLCYFIYKVTNKGKDELIALYLDNAFRSYSANLSSPFVDRKTLKEILLPEDYQKIK